MFSTEDTIVAIATPPGRGAIGVVRLSGPASYGIAQSLRKTNRPLQPRLATLSLIHSAGATLDQAIVTFFPGPSSYTGDDVVELSLHGSPVVLRGVLEAAVAAGARLAEPGEFTLRAFVNSRVDLPQAEAVADLIDAVTPLQARAAFDQLQGTLTDRIAAVNNGLFDLVARLEASIDFPDEGFHFIQPVEIMDGLNALVSLTSALLSEGRRGRLIREGLQVVIVGKPNVGKSSVFNALAGHGRAIVTSTPGTTRDLIAETVDIRGLQVTLVDSAGLRETTDPIESLGVELARRAIDVADLVLVVVDGSQPLENADAEILAQTECRKRLLVANKNDLGGAMSGFLSISAKRGDGLNALEDAIVTALDHDRLAERPAISNLRHLGLVERARDALVRARASLIDRDGVVAEELLLADLQIARGALEELSGSRVADDVLAHIFSRFCVGK